MQILYVVPIEVPEVHVETALGVMGPTIEERLDRLSRVEHELQRIGRKRAELEAEVEEIRRRGANGEAKSNGRH